MNIKIAWTYFKVLITMVLLIYGFDISGCSPAEDDNLGINKDQEEGGNKTAFLVNVGIITAICLYRIFVMIYCV